MRTFVENNLIKHLESEATKLFQGPRMEERVYQIQITDFRDLLVANSLTTIDQLTKMLDLKTLAIVEYDGEVDPLRRASLFEEMTLAEKYIVLHGLLN